jgi:hypothetical protein
MREIGRENAKSVRKAVVIPPYLIRLMAAERHGNVREADEPANERQINRGL